MALLEEHSPITTVLSSGTAFVHGAIVELLASTVRKSGWLWVLYNTIPGPIFHSQGVQEQLNIMQGPAGLETIAICNVPQACNSAVSPEGPYWQGMGFPWEFNAGVRLNCQVADENGTFPSIYLVQIRLIEKPF